MGENQPRGANWPSLTGHYKLQHADLIGHDYLAHHAHVIPCVPGKYMTTVFLELFLGERREIGASESDTNSANLFNVWKWVSITSSLTWLRQQTTYGRWDRRLFEGGRPVSTNTDRDQTRSGRLFDVTCGTPVVSSRQLAI